MQELVVQGILNNRSYPLVAGTLGAVAGALILAAGIALLRGSERRDVLARSAVAVPVFILIGIVTRIAGGPATLLGLAVPIALSLYAGKARAVANG